MAQGARVEKGVITVTNVSQTLLDYEPGAGVLNLTNKSGDNIWLTFGQDATAIVGEGMEIPGGAGNTPGGAGAGIGSLARGPITLISEGVSSDVAFLRTLTRQ